MDKKIMKESIQSANDLHEAPTGSSDKTEFKHIEAMYGEEMDQDSVSDDAGSSLHTDKTLTIHEPPNAKGWLMITDDNIKQLIYVCQEKDRAYAEGIVTAVNNFDAMKEALEQCERYFNRPWTGKSKLAKKTTECVNNILNSLNK